MRLKKWIFLKGVRRILDGIIGNGKNLEFPIMSSQNGKTVLENKLGGTLGF